MNFWEANRGLLIGAAVALVVALLVHFLVAGQARGAASGLAEECAELRGMIDALTPADGKPAPEALKDIRDERAGLEKVLGTDKTPGRVAGLLLQLPRDYIVPKNADNPRFNIFERKLAEIRERCNTSGIFPRYEQSRPESCPLGFTPQVLKEDVQLLLQRLCAANRLTGALIDASGQGSLRVKSCSHGPVRLLSSPDVSRMHLRLMPMTVRMTADERVLTAFVERISRDGSFLALQNLAVEVTDPKARTFNLTADVLALVPLDGPGPGKGSGRTSPVGPGTGTVPVGRY